LRISMKPGSPQGSVKAPHSLDRVRSRHSHSDRRGDHCNRGFAPALAWRLTSAACRSCSRTGCRLPGGRSQRPSRPARCYSSPTLPVMRRNRPFQLKLAMIALAGVNMASSTSLPADCAFVDELGSPPAAAKIAGLSSLTLWTAVHLLRPVDRLFIGTLRLTV